MEGAQRRTTQNVRDGDFFANQVTYHLTQSSRWGVGVICVVSYRLYHRIQNSFGIRRSYRFLAQQPKASTLANGTPECQHLGLRKLLGDANEHFVDTGA